MALIAIASDKGAPGVTTAALALAAVWPRPVLLAECDPAGGDLVYRFPAVGGGRLDPRRGVLSLAVVARRGMQSQQVWEHAQKLHGGLDVLAGVTNAEQGAGLSLLWGPIGKVLASLPQADVIADCGRLGADGPLYDLLAEATTVVLVTRVHVADVIRLRDRSFAFAAAAQSRGRRGFGVGVVVVADQKKFRAALGEVQHVLGQANAPATVLGGIAHDSKGADLLSGEWGGNLDRTMLIKTAREVAQHLVNGLPPVGSAPAAAPATGPQPVTPPYNRPAQPAAQSYNGPAAPSFTAPAQERPAESPPARVPAEAPRTTFSRVRGTRSGKHQADPGQADPGRTDPGRTDPGRPDPGRLDPARPAPQGRPSPDATPVEVPQLSAPIAAAPATDPGRVAARHAYNPGRAPATPSYTRPPMPPLGSTTPAQPPPVQLPLAQAQPARAQESPAQPTPSDPTDPSDQEDASWDFSRWAPGNTRPGRG